jgi:16S rRNA G966 N2-methylase RsmD
LRGKRGAKPFDIIFLDPPYSMRAVSAAIVALENAKLIKETTKIVCESEEADIFETDPSLTAYFSVRKVAKYGAAHVTVLEYGAIEQE